MRFLLAGLLVLVGCAKHSQLSQGPGDEGARGPSDSSMLPDESWPATPPTVVPPVLPPLTGMTPPGPPGGGSPPEPSACAPTAEPGRRAQVEQDGVSLVVASAGESGEWMNVAGREVVRLGLSTRHDPSPRRDDDEFRLNVMVEIVPSEMVQSTALAFHQRVEVPSPSPDHFENDEGVRVTADPDPTQVSGVRRVLVERRSFETNSEAASYRADGEVVLRWNGRRLEGSLSLELQGSLPLAFEAQTSLQITHCFEIDLPSPAACLPGATCGADCYAPEEYACSDCGTLYFTHDCGCLPDRPPLAECQPSEPASLGELCGEYWWCDRACATGLICVPGRADAAGDADAGVDLPEAACNYSRCQPL